MDVLFDKTVRILSSVLDYRFQKHKVIASNIANIDTPNYKPKDVTFEGELTGLISGGSRIDMSRNNGRHLSKQGNGSMSDSLEVVEIGDRVNIDQEMSKLADNNLMYNLSSELLARKFSSLKNLIREVK